MVKRAINAAVTATVLLTELEHTVETMPEQQKKLYEAVMRGDDDLTATLEAGYHSFFTGIVHYVSTTEGKVIKTTTLTPENVHELDEESYRRLNRVCHSKVRQYCGMANYRDYTIPVHEFAKRLAPLALGKIADLSQNARKEETQLKASKELLILAGERPLETDKDVIVPVQVNILLTGDDGHVTRLHP